MVYLLKKWGLSMAMLNNQHWICQVHVSYRTWHDSIWPKILQIRSGTSSIWFNMKNNHSKFGDLRLVELLENANHDPMTPRDYVVQPLNYQASSGPWAPNLGYQSLVSNHFRYLPMIYPIFPITIWDGYISLITSRETPLTPMKS